MNGNKFNGVMPKLDLDVAGIASALTYVRANFGNKLDPVTAQEVQALGSSRPLDRARVQALLRGRGYDAAGRVRTDRNVGSAPVRSYYPLQPR